jgi:hypothetical protein
MSTKIKMLLTLRVVEAYLKELLDARLIEKDGYALPI